MKPILKVVLTERDLAVLQFVFEQRAVSFRQLAKKFYPNAIDQTAQARLGKLTIAKYLSKSYAIWNRTRTVVYSITEKGIKAFSKIYNYQITKFDYKSDSINHDLGLVQLRERLEKAKMVAKYLSESMLQNCSTLSEDEQFMEFSNANSDAALAIDTLKNQYQVAIEYEISSKHKADYVKKLEEYYSSSNIALVLYICRNAQIEKIIHAADSEVITKLQIKTYTCLEENFHKSEGHLSFVNRKNAIFKLE